MPSVGVFFVVAMALTGLAGAVIAPVLAMPPAGAGEGPFLVVALPVAGGAEAVVERAGGASVTPVPALMGVIASGASADRLRAAGAFLVLAPPDPSFFCN
ncbi:hypothetical protein [Pseudotabrizicola algicola]|uniref:Uncharacterized protein n=1 Tax=Pseudotabrizicola algicola TaxID=2709381 RepID=A0A6B3RK65_9RHOB|nr:hypothetical protein [Pseudotabrizicola algicola]NEX46414.1 hypothetical protein [Pseudotabrizicola algicola]